MSTRRFPLNPGTGQFSRALVSVPRDEWPADMAEHIRNLPIEVWRSRDYLLQVYLDRGYTRLSISSTTMRPRGEWADAIAWDTLQRLKRECGRGDAWAVEVYPPDSRVANVANMRHLWLLPIPPPYGWHEP